MGALALQWCCLISNILFKRNYLSVCSTTHKFTHCYGAVQTKPTDATETASSIAYTISLCLWGHQVHWWCTIQKILFSAGHSSAKQAKIISHLESRAALFYMPRLVSEHTMSKYVAAEERTSHWFPPWAHTHLPVRLCQATMGEKKLLSQLPPSAFC